MSYLDHYRWPSCTLIKTSRKHKHRIKHPRGVRNMRSACKGKRFDCPTEVKR